MNPYDREPPRNDEAERALLGSMLMAGRDAPDAISDAVDALGPNGGDCLYGERHQALYAAFVTLWREDRSIDGVAIAEGLKRNGQFAKLGGYDYLATLACAVPSAARIREYAAIVRELHVLRRLIRCGHVTLAAAFEPGAKSDDVMSRCRAELDAIADSQRSERMTTFDLLVDDVLKAAAFEQPTAMVCSGLRAIDAMTGGFAPGELWVIAGLRSSGKSALAAQIADHAAHVDDVPTLLLALEDSRESVAIRLLANNARVNAADIRHHRGLPVDANNRLQAARANLRRKALAIDDAAGRSLSRIAAACRADQTRRKTGLVIIDQLSHIVRDPGEKYDRYDLELGAKTRRLKALAKQMLCPIIVCAQLNRESERNDRRPRLSDLRDSACIEHDADGVILLWGDTSAECVGAETDGFSRIETYRRYLDVAKNRNGPTHGKAPADLDWTPAYLRFDDAENPTPAAPPPENKPEPGTLGPWRK